MRRVTRVRVGVACGFVAGLALGPTSILAANLSDTLFRGWAWPEVDSRYALLLLATSTPAGINGAIGAALGGTRRLGITLLPAGVHVIYGVLSLAEPLGYVLGYQLIALTFSVVIWAAGRVGQLIGNAARRNRTTAAAAEPAIAPEPAA